MKFSDIKDIKLIVGLGNIGEEYDGTRHNIGFSFVEYIFSDTFKENKNLLSFIGVEKNQNEKLILAKPTTFMNLSGHAVSAILKYYKIKPEDMILVYDDLDLKLGEYKLQFGKHPHTHNGVNSVIASLGTNKFWNLRLGIDNRKEEEKKFIAGVDYVLGKFVSEEKNVNQKLFDEIIK